MSELHMRFTADDAGTTTLLNYVSALDGVESAEEIADLMPHMDDADSSSAGLSDLAGPGAHRIKVVAHNQEAIQRALAVSEACAHDLGAVLEVIDEET